MKKAAVILSLFIFVFLVLFILATHGSQNLDIVFVERIGKEECDTLKVCVKRSDGKLALIDINKHTEEDNHLYALKIYDYYRNALPLTYTTPLKGNFEIIKAEKNDNIMDIELKAKYLQSGTNEFLTALMWTYQIMGIDKVNLTFNKQFFYLEKNRLINPEMESQSPYDNIIQIIFFKEGDEIIPVSYCHQENRLDFLLKKVVARFPGSSYTYETEDDTLTVKINDPNYLISKDITDMILLSIEQLNLYRNIIIIKNNIVVANN